MTCLQGHHWWVWDFELSLTYLAKATIIKDPLQGGGEDLTIKGLWKRKETSISCPVTLSRGELLALGSPFQFNLYEFN